MPLILYALFAGLFGAFIHKKWYGGAAFALAIMAWIVLMQLIIAYSMHPTLN